MPVDKRYRMKIIESTRDVKRDRRPAAGARVNVKPTTAQIVRAFRRSPGAGEILVTIPKAATVQGWDKGTQIAYFSVGSKSGSAQYLDLWDCDHFDFVSDMRKSVADSRAWFSHSGYSSWGSGQTKTGQINCYFNAPASGYYSCVAQLRSDPPTARSTVECLIDNSSFGQLPFTGTILQSHFSNLSAGGHHFRIRQLDGAFSFLSLTVYSF